jgi:hypothetical protein
VQIKEKNKMCKKRNFVIAILSVSMLLAVANVTQAATEAEKQAAIDAGLVWLAGQQQGDGRWEYGDTGSDIGATAAALLAFIEEGHTPSSGTTYSANVADGLNFLLSYAQTYAIGGQPAGDPDTNGNGIGVKFNYTASNEGRDIYATGLALMPIAAVGTPGAIVPVGPQAGRTYADVIQDTVDYFAFAQNEGGWPRGGWRYYANYGSSDNSTSQWPTVALLYAQSAGATVPAFVATELAFWVVYIQNPADGGSYYDSNFGGWGSNVSRTGTLLIQQVFSGVAAGIGPALNYLNGQWLTTQNSTWNGNFGHPYAMWAAYKGLQVTIGLDADQSVISNLHADPGNVDNPNHGWNWWEDYCEYLVSTQAGGTWPGYSYWSGPLATAWYINILAATEIPPPHIEVAVDIKPTSCPNPLNVKNNGVLPVAIVGTEDFDVTTVDPASVRLIGVAPIRCSLEDVVTPFEPYLGKESEYDCTEEGPDGYLDLTLKFDVQEIVEVLGEVNDGDVMVLLLTGNLYEEYDGTPIVGEDVVIILKKGK